MDVLGCRRTVALFVACLYLCQMAVAVALECPPECLCPSPQEALCSGVVGEVTQLVAALGAGAEHIEALEAADGGAQELGNCSLSALSSLRRLILDGNRIARVDEEALSGAWQLRELSLNGNLLQRLPADAFGRAPALDRLFLSRNPLQLPRGAPLLRSSLRWLQMDSCGFTRLPDHVFQGTGNLRVLQLRDNALETLGRALLTLQRLSVLALQGNRLVRQTFALPPNLQLLNANDNDLGALDKGMFDSARNLEYLFLANNYISHVHGSSLMALERMKYLDIGGNKLNNSFRSVSSDVSLELNHLENLSNIKIDGNDIEMINLEIFMNMKSLKEISLSRNKIKTVTNLQDTDWDDDYYDENEDSGRPALEILTLSENKINFLGSSLRPYMDSLLHLNLSNNKLSSFSSSRLTQKSRSSLKLLDLSFNKINPSYAPTLDLDYLPNLEYLSLRNNGIENMDENSFKRLKKLKFLNLSYNKFNNLPQNLFRNQKEIIDLQINFLNMETGVQDIPELLLASMSNLLTLSMVGNNIKYIPRSLFNSLIRLETVDLSYNNLDFLNLEVFSSSGNLKKLDLKYNRMHYISCSLKVQCTFHRVAYLNIEGNSFRNIDRNFSTVFPSLESLDISKNKLDHLEFDVLATFEKLTTVKASFNPVPCDCNVHRAWQLYGGEQGATIVEATCNEGGDGGGGAARPWATAAALRCEGAAEAALQVGVVVLAALVAANVVLAVVLFCGVGRNSAPRGRRRRNSRRDEGGCCGQEDGARSEEESDDSDNTRNARVERWRGQALYYGTDSEEDEEDPARAGLPFEYDALRWAAARRATSRSTVNVSATAY